MPKDIEFRTKYRVHVLWEGKAKPARRPLNDNPDYSFLQATYKSSSPRDGACSVSIAANYLSLLQLIAHRMPRDCAPITM
jgi:hypothetical protein